MLKERSEQHGEVVRRRKRQIKFNTDKCTVMHLGRNINASRYVLNDKGLKESESEEI